jgi:hypothetical protein
MIHPFGFIFIGLVIAIMSSTSLKEIFYRFFLLEAIFSVFRLNYGYFINIGSSEILYNEILIGALFILSLIVILHINKLNRALLISIIFLLITVSLGVFKLYFYPENVMTIGFNDSWDLYLRGIDDQMQYISFGMQSILMLIRVVIFSVILLAVSAIFTKSKWLEVLNILTIMAKVIILYGLVEIVIKFLFNIDTNDYLISLFGRGVSTGGDVNRLQGLSREPSYYASALFNIMVIFLIQMKINQENRTKFKKYVIWMIFVVGIGVISTAFSFFVMLATIFIIYFILFKSKNSRILIKNFFVYLVFAVIVLIIAWNMGLLLEMQFVNRFVESFVQIEKGIYGTYVLGVDYSSEASRLIGIIESFKSYLSSPLIGLGIGTTYCVSGVVSILANTGLLGLVFWVRTIVWHYCKQKSVLLGLSVLLPVTVTGGVDVMYDTSYLVLIPLLNIAYFINSKRNT